MSIAAHAHSTYGFSTHAIKTARDIEYGVLARATRALQEHQPAAMRAQRVTAEFAQALVDNQRLWTAFAVDLSHPDNGLDESLRARLLYLAEFTLRHTTTVLAGEASARVLIDINTAVMRGLRGHGAGT